MRKIFVLSALLIFNFSFLTIKLHAQHEFTVNKGQWHENVNYKMSINNGAIFLEDNAITYNFVGKEDINFSTAHHGAEGSSTALLRNGHAYKVVFRNSNKNPKIQEHDKTIDYCNYYIGNDRSKWASYVSKFRNVTYLNLYDGIDANYFATTSSMKYDFIVHPGANIKDIDMEYQGADMLFIENGIFKKHQR